MKRVLGATILLIVASPAAADHLLAEKLPGETIRWNWTVEPLAVSYDLAGGPLPGSDIANGTCRTDEDADPADTIFDDPIMPPTASGEYLVVAANEGDASVLAACQPAAAYFCVRDATGDSFVIKLDEEEKITHARNVIRGIEQERIHVGATDMGGAVPWNPGWHFHIPPDAVYFFDQQMELCDASIEEIEQGGMPAGHWCPWTSDIFGELLPYEQWSGPDPEPFYCGPVVD